MRLTDRAAEEIRVTLARRRMSARELARRLEVSPPWVSDRLNGAKEIGLNEIETIAIELDVPIRQLLGLDAAELPDELAQIKAVVDDEEVPANERDFLLRMLRPILPMWRDIPRPAPTKAPARRGR